MIISSPSREGKFVVSNQKPVCYTQKPCYMSVEGVCCKNQLVQAPSRVLSWITQWFRIQFLPIKYQEVCDTHS